MKKNIIKILFTIFLLCSFSSGFADTTSDYGANLGDGGNIADSTARTIKVVTTEKMPGIECREQLSPSDETGEDKTGRYECYVPVGMGGALEVLGSLIRWMTGFALLCSVLFLVFNGIHLSMGGVDDGAKGEVKKRIQMTLAGIVLLLLSGPILKLIAPWIYR